MKEDFTPLECIKALIIPVFTALCGAFDLITGLILGKVVVSGIGIVSTLIFPLLMILVGGVLPIILTLRLNIHTEDYFLGRVIVIVFGFPLVNVWYDRAGYVIYAVWGVVNLLFEVFNKSKYQQLTGEERAVMIMSNTMIWVCCGKLLECVVNWLAEYL